MSFQPKSVAFVPGSEGEHLEKLCSNVLDNFHIYFTYLQASDEMKYKLQEMAVVNVFAKHIVAMSRHMEWQPHAPTLSLFRKQLANHLFERVAECIDHMEKAGL